MKSTQLFSLLAFVCCTALARADVIVHDVTSPDLRRLGTAQVDVPPFDPRLGSLQRVEIEITSSFSGVARLENASATMAQADVFLRSRSLLRVPNQPSLTCMDLRAASCFLLPSDGQLDFAGQSARSFAIDFALQQSVVLTTGLEDWQSANPARVVPLRAETRSGLSVNCDVDFAADVLAGARHTVRVVYVYKPIG